METNGKDVLSWLHGLEDFLKFIDNKEATEYVHHYLSLNYSDDPLNTVKKLIISAKERTSEEDFPSVITFILKAFKAISTDSDDIIDLDNWARIARIMFPEENIFSQLHRYFKNKNSSSDIISDAFSKGQIQSKIWLTDELANIKDNYNNVLVLAGWYGQFKLIYSKKLNYSLMRFVDLDRISCEISDSVFNLKELHKYKVKSVNADINGLTLHKNGYEWSVENFKDGSTYNEKFLPNLIINTSSEHMSEEWYNQIRFKNLDSNPIVAIQSNNLFEIPEHINCVHSTDHMKKKFPMKEILFEGELQLKGYKRFMLIGRP
jgi:hypothetical protein